MFKFRIFMLCVIPFEKIYSMSPLFLSIELLVRTISPTNAWKHLLTGLWFLTFCFFFFVALCCLRLLFGICLLPWQLSSFRFVAFGFKVLLFIRCHMVLRSSTEYGVRCQFLSITVENGSKPAFNETAKRKSRIPYYDFNDLMCIIYFSIIE